MTIPYDYLGKGGVVLKKRSYRAKMERSEGRSIRNHLKTRADDDE